MTNYTGHPDQRFGHISYAQHGDDFMLLSLVDRLGITPSALNYIDVGAHHPNTISNTKLLYDRGFRGIHVEANPNLIEAFEKERPDELILNVGVAPEAGRKAFYMYSDLSGRNTFSPDEVKSLDGVLTVQTTLIINVVTLNSIIDKHCRGVWPDILSIDIEGLDYGVLKSCTFSAYNAPKIICVETRLGETQPMVDLLKTKSFWPYARMGENLFFLRRGLKFFVFGADVD